MGQAMAAGLMTFGFSLVMSMAVGADQVIGLEQSGINDVLLRADTAPSFAGITEWLPDTNVRVIAPEGRWRHVRLDDHADGWVAIQFLSEDDPTTTVEVIGTELQVGDAAVVSGLDGPNARLPLRDGPSRDAALIARLPNGTDVMILGAQGPWNRVVTEDGEIGWLRGRFLVAGQEPDAPTPRDDLRWTHWTNARFGMTIDYPAALFGPEPAPENGDGQSFISPDGEAGFFVFGQWNVLDLSLEELYEMDLGTGVFGTVTESRLSADSYIISGQAEGRFTYRRALMPPPGDVLYVFEISYPAVVAETFSAVVERMSASFRVTGGDEGQLLAPQSPDTPHETEQDGIEDLLATQLRDLLERLP